MGGANVQGLINKIQEALSGHSEQLEADVPPTLEGAIDALLNKYHFYRDFFDEAPDMFVSVNPKTSIITECNATIARKLGYEKSEIIGKKVTELYHPASLEMAQRNFLTFVKRGTVDDAELELLCRDGSSIKVSINVSAVRDETGKIIASRSIWRDLTETHLLYDLKKQVQELEILRCQSERSESALRVSQQRLRSHLSRTPLAALAWNLNLQITEWNPAAEKLFGYTATEAVGQSVLNLIVPKDNRARVEKTIHRLFNHEGGYINVNDNITKSGERITCQWGNSNIVEMDGEVVGGAAFAQDITQRTREYEEVERLVAERTANLCEMNRTLQNEIHHREKTETALRMSEQSYAALAGMLPVGVFRYLPTGECIYVNERCVQIIGCSKEEALGTGWAKNLHPEDYDRIFVEWQKTIEQHTMFGQEFRFCSAMGGDVWVYGQIVGEFDVSGKLLEFVGTITDITLQKEMQAALRENEEAYRKHQNELAHISRQNTMGEMVSGIAHEVNQPLAMIVNYTAGCLERMSEDLPEDLRQIMERVSHQAERAGEIMHRLKDFLSKGSLTKKPTDVNQVVCDTVFLLECESSDKRAEVTLELAEALPQIVADKIQLEQVLLNLVHNAQEAMLEAESLRQEVIIQTQQITDDLIQIMVEDSGPGADQETLSHLFDPFYTTKVSGMGMGLSISYSIVKAHGGQIVPCASRLGGLGFRITLPVEVHHE